MEKQHVNPYFAKKQAESEKGKKLADELENLNWKLQELSFKILMIRSEYDYKQLKYKKFLGYDVSLDELQKAESEYKEMVKIEEKS